MTVLSVESDRERAVARQMREIALSEFDVRGDEEVAKILGISPSGVEALRWRGEWPLTLAFRVIDALQLDLVEHWQAELGQSGANGSHAPGS